MGLAATVTVTTTLEVPDVQIKVTDVKKTPGVVSVRNEQGVFTKGDGWQDFTVTPKAGVNTFIAINATKLKYKECGTDHGGLHLKVDDTEVRLPLDSPWLLIEGAESVKKVSVKFASQMFDTSTKAITATVTHGWHDPKDDQKKKGGGEE